MVIIIIFSFNPPTAGPKLALLSDLIIVVVWTATTIWSIVFLSMPNHSKVGWIVN